jgi:hypothetical protein
MIFKLEFDWLGEFANSNSRSNSSLIELHSILDNSLLLHKYVIPFSGINKFQVSNHDKIDYSLIKQKSIIVLHLDIYKDNTESVRNTIEWCLTNNRNLFIPIQSKTSYRGMNIKSEFDVRHIISDIIREYSGDVYNLSNNLEFSLLKRDLIINSILDIKN